MDMSTQTKKVPQHLLAVSRLEHQPKPERRRARPRLLNLYHGPVTTTIWANYSPWGEVLWRVNQTKEYQTAEGKGYTQNFAFEDLDHQIQGLQEARKIIKKAKGHMAWRRLLPWAW